MEYIIVRYMAKRTEHCIGGLNGDYLIKEILSLGLPYYNETARKRKPFKLMKNAF